MNQERLGAEIASLVENVERVIRGKREAVRLAVLAVLARGHLLLEDVPGTGKTQLARALARSFEGEASRVQFTPDLLPSDVTGVHIYSPKTGEFSFRPGPVFAHVVLADEVNRGTPRTQSALLECMEEHRVTVEGKTFSLPAPFFVVATQNPVDYEGTYPLPEAQLDRFLMCLSLGPPDEEAAVEAIRTHLQPAGADTLAPVSSPQGLAALQETVGTIHVADPVLRYVHRIAARTRAHPRVRLGVSQRASVHLTRAGQAHAALEGRGHVTPSDIKRLAPYVLAHRLRRTPEAVAENMSASAVVEELLESVPIPLVA